MKGDVMMVTHHVPATEIALLAVGQEEYPWVYGSLECLVPRLQNIKSFNDNYFGSHWEIVDVNN